MHMCHTCVGATCGTDMCTNISWHYLGGMHPSRRHLQASVLQYHADRTRRVQTAPTPELLVRRLRRHRRHHRCRRCHRRHHRCRRCHRRHRRCRRCNRRRCRHTAAAATANRRDRLCTTTTNNNSTTITTTTSSSSDGFYESGLGGRGHHNPLTKQPSQAAPRHPSTQLNPTQPSPVQSSPAQPPLPPLQTHPPTSYFGNIVVVAV